MKKIISIILLAVSFVSYSQENPSLLPYGATTIPTEQLNGVPTLGQVLDSINTVSDEYIPLIGTDTLKPVVGNIEFKPQDGVFDYNKGILHFKDDTPQGVYLWGSGDKYFEIYSSDGDDGVTISSKKTGNLWNSSISLSNGGVFLYGSDGDEESGGLSVDFNGVKINNNYTIPKEDGLPGQVLTTNGGGVVDWTTITIDPLLDWNKNNLPINDVTTTPYNANTLFNGAVGSTTLSAVGANMPYQSRWIVKSFRLDGNNSMQVAYDVSTSANLNTNTYVRKYRSGTWGNWNRLWSDADFTSTNVTNWNSAYGWGNHALAGYTTETWVEENFLSDEHPAAEIDSADISHWDIAYDERHIHTNKDALDEITEVSIGNWETAYTHSQVVTGNPHGTKLTDLPDILSAYTGNANKLLSVNGGATGVQFRSLLPADIGLTTNGSVPYLNSTVFGQLAVGQTSAVNNSLAQRTSAGALFVTAPTTGLHAVNRTYLETAVASLPYIPIAGNTTGTRVQGDIHFRYDANIALDARDSKVTFNNVDGYIDLETPNGVRMYQSDPNLFTFNTLDGIKSGVYIVPTTPTHYTQKQYVDTQVAASYQTDRTVITLFSDADWVGDGSVMLDLTRAINSIEWTQAISWDICWDEGATPATTYKRCLRDFIGQNDLLINSVNRTSGGGLIVSLNVTGNFTIPAGARLILPR